MPRSFVLYGTTLTQLQLTQLSMTKGTDYNITPAILSHDVHANHK